MTDYQVAVPSYHRPQQVVDQTLRTLATHNVPMDRVHVFLHDNDPHVDAYRENLDLMGVECVVTSARGIGQQRDAIMRHFPEGTRIVSLDDDVREVITVRFPEEGKPRWADAREVTDLDALILEMFSYTEQAGLHVWGLYPSCNPFFLKDKIIEGLIPFTYTLFGFINRPGHPAHQQTVTDKDDYEFCIRTWWYDGAVVRNERVSVKTTYYTDGGMQVDGRDQERVQKAIDKLAMQWPGIVHPKPSRKSGWPEIRLSRKGRHPGNPLNTLPPGVPGELEDLW